MARPYISWSIDQLEALFQSSSGALEDLSRLKEELALRKTKRAQHLLLKVNQASGVSIDPPQLELGLRPGSVDSQEHVFDAESESDFNEMDGAAPPDDRGRPQAISQMRPTGTAGLPSPWIRPLEQDLTLSLPADAQLPQLYGSALGALIAEIKKTGAGQKRYELEKGRRIEGRADEFVYDFPFTDEADLFEEAKVEVELPGRRIDATIVSISSGRILLAAREDLGPVLHRAVIVVDATALLEALREKVEQAGKAEIPINRDLADAAVRDTDHPHVSSPIPFSMSATSLDSAQVNAVKRALSESITYIWGPPGTGKTRVLGEIVRSALDGGKRVLICSNTNKAVDQVLLKTCDTLGVRHPAMDEGKIVRLGSIALDVLRSRYEAYVTIDGIVERKSADLKERLLRLQDEIARLDARTASARAILIRFAELGAAQQTVEFHKKATNTLDQTGRELMSRHEGIRPRITMLETELANPKRGILGRLFRSETQVRKELLEEQRQLALLSAELDKAKISYEQAKCRFDNATQERDRIQAGLAGKDRATAEGEVARADERRAPLVEELREVENKLADIRAAVLKDARVLGATCTKTYLAAREVGQVDMVIVDEASMVLLPMIWFAAGRARERVVICGDPRQIPPIVATRQQAIFDVLGKDVFAAARLDGMTDGDPRTVMLESQHRMHRGICELISGPMYRGRLKTVPHPNEQPSPPQPYDQTLTIIDTSDLWPFESVNPYFSRFNLMHALLVRNLAWHFRREGYIHEQDDLAVCTPYSAQAKLIRKLLDNEEFGDQVHVGTVHSFQGDERNAVVLELPEGYGGARMVGQFLQGVPPAQVGARLINVAVSRAKNHLLVLANLTYLDQMLPSSALLRGILYDMQQNGRVIHGSNLLALRPIQSDLEGLIGHVDLKFNAKTLGLFDGPAFETAVEVDIARAKDSVVLFSGFVTPQRVGKIGDLLRSKVSEGVKIRCVTRPPHLNGSVDEGLGQQALNMLEGIGCTVDGRARIHEKVILIDKQIVWHGSLNVLSHNHRTDESMTRVVNAGFAQAVAANMSKRRVSNAAALQQVANAENPRCGRCGNRTFYDEGKYGAYFRCERRCGWSSNLKKVERGDSQVIPNRSQDFPAHGPPCPLCKSKTVLREGRFGPFYGCSKYPACAGKCQPAAKKAKAPRKRSSVRR